jgi:predicted Ser/Thr protein kinase
MSVDDNTQQFSDSEPRIDADPLGIIGWEIGGKYRIRSYIGGGGFGEVYDAYNLNLIEQRLVIKFFKRVQARDRFDREARILCMLDHPNISRVIDFLPDEGALVVQYIDGKDAARIIRELGTMPADQFLKVARAITEAIAYAHEKKVAHRDIKPANILIDKNGHVYLIDFGIAKEVGGNATKTGYQALTPMFAAPERQTGESSYNPFLSDIYELGITLFNFCTNSMPYRNPVSPSLAEWGGPSAEPLAPQLKHILRKATHPEPGQRYQTAAEMAAEFRNLNEVYIRRKRKGTGLVVGVLVAIALATAGYQYRDGIADLFAGSESEQQTAVTKPVEEVGGGEGLDAAGPAALPLEEGAGQPLGTPQESQAQVVQQPAEEPEVVEVPAPAPPELTIRIRPADVFQLYVDGRQRRPGVAFEASAGSHSVEIVHPDYPVLRKTVRMRSEATVVTYSMEREFTGADTLSLQLALFPPSDKNLVEFNLNGRSRRYTRFPVFDLQCLSGKWNLQANIVPVNDETGANPKIDSCVTFPYGRGPRNKITGSGGVIELLGGENGNTVPLLIYWSE